MVTNIDNPTKDDTEIPLLDGYVELLLLLCICFLFFFLYLCLLLPLPLPLCICALIGVLGGLLLRFSKDTGPNSNFSSISFPRQKCA